jgi:allene oxide cyclase
MHHFRPRRAFALAATTAVAAGAIVGTGASDAKTQRAHATGTTVHVIEHAVTDTVIQSGGGKDKKGNLLTFNNNVYNVANKKIVGHDEGFCTRISPKDGSWECLWTTFLSGGQITVQGPYYDKRNSVLSITGGTGKYSNARGQMVLNARDGGAEYDFIFELN